MSDGASFFDEAALHYDQSCRRLVPDLDGFYGAVVEGLSFGRDEELRVLDLGAGTGLLSAKVAEAFPAARITLVDFSAEMLQVARRRFAEDPDRFEFHVMDYVREPLPGEQESYDLIVSALSIHHLARRDKRETFEKVHGSLASGGRFVNADRVESGTPEAEHEQHSEDRPHHAHAHATEEASLEYQIAWMREAGFEEVECHYRNSRYVVYGGRKGERKERDVTDE